MSKACIIRGYTYRHNGRYHVNAETTGIDDIWITMVPSNHDHDKEEPTPLCVFESKTEATMFLRRLRFDTKASGDDIKWYIETIDHKSNVNYRIKLSSHHE